jgi:hypothetical protein
MRPVEIPQKINFDTPSPETLGGVYVCLEGQEDLTVRPRQIAPVHVDDHARFGENGQTGTNANEGEG